jgi:hypothetical protein
MKKWLVVLCAAVLQPAAAFDSLAVRRPAWVFSWQSGALVQSPEATAFWSAACSRAFTQMPRLHAGISVGLDTYPGWQVFPVALLVRFDLSDRNPWFLQCSAGPARARLTPAYRPPFGFDRDYGGMGYFAGVGKAFRYGRVEVALMAGYRVQAVGWVEQVRFGTIPHAPMLQREVEQTLRRLAIALQVSWR